MVLYRRSRLKRALETRKDLYIKINWRAFQLNPEMPREGIPIQQYLALKFGNKERAASIYSNIQKAGIKLRRSWKVYNPEN